MRHAAPALLFCLLSAAACGDTVEVAVELGICTEAAFAELGSLDTVLKREDGASWLPPCVASGPISNTQELSRAFAESFRFRDVPSGGTWTLAVKGFRDGACENAVFCGRTRGFTLPPSGGRIVVRINCPPTYGDTEDYKDCVRE